MVGWKILAYNALELATFRLQVFLFPNQATTADM